MLSKQLFAFILLFFHYTQLIAQDAITEENENNFDFRAVAELGFLAVLDHNVQFSKRGTYFDYKSDGGQNVLFPVSRFSQLAVFCLIKYY